MSSSLKIWRSCCTPSGVSGGSLWRRGTELRKELRCVLCKEPEGLDGMARAFMRCIQRTL